MADKNKKKHAAGEGKKSEAAQQGVNGLHAGRDVPMRLGKECDDDSERVRLKGELVKLQEWIKIENQARESSTRIKHEKLLQEAARGSAV